MSCNALSKQKTSCKHRVKRSKAPELKTEPSFSELSSLIDRNIRCGAGKNGYRNPEKKCSKLDNIIFMLSVLSLFLHCYFIESYLLTWTLLHNVENK